MLDTMFYKMDLHYRCILW